MASDDVFNRMAAGEFLPEYERETGVRLTLQAVGDPFPDLILKNHQNTKIEAELVSIVLPFINQENSYFDRYRARFLAGIRKLRSKPENVIITLQPATKRVEQPRPFLLPAPTSPQGRQIVEDFVRLIDRLFDTLSRNNGGQDGSALLTGLREPTGELSFPALGQFYEGILFHHMTPAEIKAHRSPDPVIRNPVIFYSNQEKVAEIHRTLKKKSDKGYKADILIVHTLLKPGIDEHSGISHSPEEIIETCQTVLRSLPDLTARFTEIWFLNRSIKSGKRLYRLK